MIRAIDFANRAKNGGYIGIPYNKLDCQGFVKRVINDLGGSAVWIGSNDMWRHKTHDRRKISESPPKAGELVFIVKHDGGEPSYYADGVNASHVGIYTGSGVVESTTGGVQYHDGISSKWTHAAKLNCITYESTATFDEYNAGFNAAIVEIESILGGMKK